MHDPRQRLSRMPPSDCDRSDYRTNNTREEPTPEEQPTTGWQPVSPSGTPYPVLLAASPKRFRRGLAAASSRRQGQQHDHTMHDHTDGREYYTRTDTSGCVRGASGVPPTRRSAGEVFSPAKSGGKDTTSGASGVYQYHARERTRTPARGHTYARLRKVGIPLTPLTRVRGTRRSYQNAEVSE